MSQDDKDDAQDVADAFQQMFSAAMKINEALSRNERLNDSVPANWPLPLSADEFAHACLAMAGHYEELAK